MKATGKAIPAVVRRAIEANTQSASASSSSAAKKQKFEATAVAGGNLDQDDPVDADSSTDDSSDDDDDDDTAALLEELIKIKRERAQDSAVKEQERKQDDERIRMENIISGNPLLTYSSGGPAGVTSKNGSAADLKVKPKKKHPKFILTLGLSMGSGQTFGW